MVVGTVGSVALEGGRSWPSSADELMAVQRALADLHVEPWHPPRAFGVMVAVRTHRTPEPLRVARRAARLARATTA